MDSALPQSADLADSMTSESAEADAVAGTPSVPAQASQLTIQPALAAELCSQAGLERTGLTEGEFAEVLANVGAKCNFGQPAEIQVDGERRAQFLRILHLRDLALAHACVRGREIAWQRFVEQYRSPLHQAAAGITGSVSAGEELADSLYSELFGLTEREGKRLSPLATYSGRGSLMGWLRATLAQRHVTQHRRTYRESPLESHDIPSQAVAADPAPEMLLELNRALSATLRALSPEERFLLSAWFLDGHTLLEIARLLRVHEATVSRRIHRVTAKAHKQLLKQLESGGMSRRAAQEALGTDPRDLSVNLRRWLQNSPASAFYSRAAETGQEPR